MSLYEEYIKLGLKREEWNDSVNESKYGYGGYYLFKELNSNAFIQIDWLTLDQIELCITNNNNILYKVILSFVQLKELLNFKN